MFRAGTDIFLDDLTVEDLALALHTDVQKVGIDGGELLYHLLKR